MVNIDKNDRIMIIVPHPDDETIGCGGVIQRAKSMNLPVLVVYLTYGDANEWSFIKSSRWKLPILRPSSVKKMGEKRYNEALSACKILGLYESEIKFLGYPDFGTLNIWNKHWRDSKPVKGLFTKSKQVPYLTAFRPGAPYKGEEILQDLKSLMRDFSPTKVFTSHRLDFNPDHQALYLFVRIALWDLKKEISPQLFPFLSHFGKWPQPRGLKPNLKMQPPKGFIDGFKWTSFNLKIKEIKVKEKALNQHKTQITTTPKYLLSFIRQNELFSDYQKTLKTPQLEKEIVQEGEYSHFLEINKIEEDEDFIGLDEVKIRIDENYLIENVKISRKLGRDAVINFYIFPYSFDKPFGKSPKYQIKIKKNSFEVFELQEELPAKTIKIDRDRKTRQIELKFPMSYLHSPDILLINVRSVINRVTVDWIPWRIIRMT